MTPTMQYNVFVNINCANGRFNDIYMVNAKDEAQAAQKATQRVIDEMDGVTEVDVIGCLKVNR